MNINEENLFNFNEFISRIKNFSDHTNHTDELINQYKNYFIEINSLNKQIFQGNNINPNKPFEEKLFDVLHEIYDTTVNFFPELQFIKSDKSFDDSVYKAYILTSLGIFIHGTKRIKGKSITDFVAQNEPYISEYDNKEDKKDYSENCASPKFRKSRQRTLSKRPFQYDEPMQWNGMRKSSEYEWSLGYKLESDDVDSVIPKTFKKFKNLYNDVDSALSKDSDKITVDELDSAYNKFKSKLNKISYENYLKLMEFIFSFISENKEYYGMNFYRFEKELMPFSTINQVKALSQCDDEGRKQIMYMRSIILKNEFFPKIFIALYNNNYINQINCTYTLNFFRSVINNASRLVLDELVEINYFGDDWKILFVSTINNLAEDVFYDPSVLDFKTNSERENDEFHNLYSREIQMQIDVKKEKLKSNKSPTKEE